MKQKVKKGMKGLMLSMVGMATLITPSFNINANAVRISSIGRDTKLIKALDYVGNATTIAGKGTKTNEEYQNTNGDKFITRSGFRDKWTCAPGAPLGTSYGGNEVNLQYIDCFPNGYNYAANESNAVYGKSDTDNRYPIGEKNAYFKDCVVIKSCRYANPTKNSKFVLPLNGYLCYNTSTNKFFVISTIPATFDALSYNNRNDGGYHNKYNFQIVDLKVYEGDGESVKNKKSTKKVNTNVGNKNAYKINVIYSSEFDLDDVESVTSKVEIKETSPENKSYTAEAKFNVGKNIIKGLKEGSVICCNFEDYFNRPISLTVDKKNRLISVECPQRMDVAMYDYRFLMEGVQIHLQDKNGSWSTLDENNTWNVVDDGQCHVDFTNVDLEDVNKIQADVYLTWEYYGMSKGVWWSGETKEASKKVAYKYIIASDLSEYENEDEDNANNEFDDDENSEVVVQIGDVASYIYKNGEKIYPNLEIKYDDSEGKMNVTVTHPINNEGDTYQYRLEKLQVYKNGKKVSESTDVNDMMISAKYNNTASVKKLDDSYNDDELELEEEEEEELEEVVTTEKISIPNLNFKKTDKISVYIYTSYAKATNGSFKQGKKTNTYATKFGKGNDVRYAKRVNLLKKKSMDELIKQYQNK